MQGTVHLALIRLAAILFLGLGVACRTTVDVFLDAQEDFSRYRTWDWVSRTFPMVDAPHADGRALDARLARLIERDLLERGFERSTVRPDFLVSYHLALRRRAVVALEPAAPYLLSSLNSSPSYWIEGGSRKVLQVHEDVRLVIRISDASSSRRTFRAVLLRTFVNVSVVPLDGAVATLLDRFPRTEPRSEVDERRR